MKWSKEYMSTAVLYLIVIIYIIVENNHIVTALLVTGLFIYHTVVYTRTFNKVVNDSENTLTKLEVKLAKSKRKQEESYKRFLSLTTSFGSGLLMVDEDGIIKLANKEFKTYFNMDINNTDYKDLINVKPLYKFVNQAYLLEKTIREQIKVHEKVYDLISTPLFENNIFKGALILIHDITLINNAEKFQKSFTADVSHELRTPLAAIKGFSEILGRDEKIESKAREEFINLIHKESERMEYILNDLLIISKMDRLDYELDIQKHDISFVVDECVSVMKIQFERKKLECFVEVKSKLLEMDKFRMSQVIMNLIKNAINYTNTGHLRIQGYEEGGEYILFFEDTGIGIDEKNVERIFKRFYRVDKARSRESGGSGLGLSICKNVILKHGGTISVESKLKKGSKFIVKLPI